MTVQANTFRTIVSDTPARSSQSADVQIYTAAVMRYIQFWKSEQSQAEAEAHFHRQQTGPSEGPPGKVKRFARL